MTVGNRLTKVLLAVVLGLTILYTAAKFLEPHVLQHASPAPMPFGRADSAGREQQDTNPITDVTAATAERQPGLIRGSVISSDGQPLSGVDILVTSMAAPVLPAANKPATSDSARTFSQVSNDAGEFVVTNLEPATYVCTASHLGSTGERLVTLTAQAPVGEVFLVLTPSTTVSGIVVDEGGTPLAGARVTPVAREGRPVSIAVQNAHAILSDTNGRFSVAGLRMARWHLAVRAEGYAGIVVGPVEFGKDDLRCVLQRVLPTTGYVLENDGPQQPVAGATVIATACDIPLEPVEVRTGDDGAFEFTSLPPAPFFLTAASKTLTMVEAPIRIERLEPYPSKQREIHIQLERGAAIQGTVANVDSGPLEGRIVVARANIGHLLVYESQPTDASGIYRIGNLPPGEYTVTLKEGLQGLPFVASPTSTRQVRLATSQLADHVDLTVVLGVTIAGKVVDETGEPVAGAQVMASAAASDDQLLGHDTPCSNFCAAVSGEDGRFLLTGFANAQDVMVVARTTMRTSKQVGPMPVPEMGFTDLVLRLELDRTASVAGRVVSRNGVGVKSSITASPRKQGEAWAGSVTSETSPDGSFLLHGLQAGVYDLLLLLGQTNRPNLRTLTMTEGQHISGMTLVYDQDLQEIGGRVVNEEAAAVQGALVHVQSMGDASGASNASVFTTLEGTFRIAALVSGQYAMEVSAKGYEPVRIASVIAGEAMQDIVLRRPYTVIGRVIDDATNRPVSQFQAALQPAGENGSGRLGNYREFSDPDGRFALEWTRDAGTIVVRAAGYVLESRPLGPIGAWSTEPGLTIALKPSTLSVKGQVVDMAGNAVPGASVYLELMPASPAETQPDTVSDAYGSFTVSTDKPDLVAVYVYHSVSGMGSMEAIPKPQDLETTQTTVQLAPAAALEGTVNLDNKPVPHLSVTLTSNHGRSRTAITDDNGHYVFATVYPGSATVHTRRSGDGTLYEASMAVSLDAGSISTADLTLVATADDSHAE